MIFEDPKKIRWSLETSPSTEGLFKLESELSGPKIGFVFSISISCHFAWYGARVLANPDDEG